MPEATPVRALGQTNERGCRVLSDAGLAYADGAEARLLEIVSNATDISSSSQELADAASDWGTTYSLTPTRSNVVRTLDLRPDMRVLEIGCGCGPITRYLGEQCGTVDAVEPMEARAAVARARTRDLESVEVFVGVLDDVPAVPVYDLVVVVGVLEYIGDGADAREPYLRFLEQVHAVLKPGGTLLLAIENPLGVKYIAGAVEDHTNRPFDSLEDYALESPARTFTRRALGEMLADAGFASSFLSAFPDYKLPRAVMSDELFRKSGQLVENLPKFPSPDYLVPRMNLADERLAWRTLIASGVAEHFANSFITLATKGEGVSLWPEERLALLFNADRQPQYAVRGEIREVDGALTLVRGPLHPHVEPHAATDDVLHQVAASEVVVVGRPMLQAMVAEPELRPELLRRWAEMVPSDGDRLPVDLVPHNVILTPDGELAAIDQEWFVRGYDRECVLMRGLFLSAMQMAALTRPQRLAPWQTVADAVHAMAGEIGLEVTDETVDRFIANEARFQAAVNTTDEQIEARQLQSAQDLRGMFDLSLTVVRGGPRFDEQWARASEDLKDHDLKTARLVAKISSLEADLRDSNMLLERTSERARAYDRFARWAPRNLARTVIRRARLKG